MNPVYLPIGQTLLGVLCTLVGVCIVISDGNFIKKILGEISNKIQIKIKNIKKSVSFSSIDHDPKYVAIKNKKEAIDLKIKNDTELEESEIKLYKDFSLWQVDYLLAKQRNYIKVSNKTRKKLYRQIKNVAQYKDPNLSALLMFAISLIILVADALLPHYIVLLPFVTNFCYSLLGLSVIYLSMIWLRYLFPNTMKIRWKLHDAWHQHPIYLKMSTIFSIYLIIIFGIWIIMNRCCFSIVEIWDTLFYTTLIILAIWSIMQIIFRARIGKYDSSAIIKHFAYFSLLSLILSFIVTEMIGNIIMPQIVFDNPYFTLGNLVIICTALYGLILPFTLPLLKYVYAHSYANWEVYKTKRYAIKNLKKLKKGIDPLYLKLDENIPKHWYQNLLSSFQF